MLNNPVFEGPFKQEMEDFIALKRAVGFKYDTEPGTLKRFDTYLIMHFPCLTALTREAVSTWCAKTMHETIANQCSRSSIIRQFAKYLDNIGKEAWIIPSHYHPKVPKYVPHIYTTDELRRFFAETDKCHFCYEHPHRHLIMPVFFRLLFSCGLRCSEARLLKVKDVDLEKGVLSIMDSKNHNDRLVPMADSITLRMRTYAVEVHPFPEPDRYFFPAFGEKPMTVGNIYKNFRRFLWHAGISHTGAGPRVHDFRHTFCVYRLKTWAHQERELMALFPLLRTYLGHQTFNETAYYLSLTADVFPYLRLKIEQYYHDIIPSMEGLSYDTN